MYRSCTNSFCVNYRIDTNICFVRLDRVEMALNLRVLRRQRPTEKPVKHQRTVEVEQKSCSTALCATDNAAVGGECYGAEVKVRVCGVGLTVRECNADKGNSEVASDVLTIHGERVQYFMDAN